MYFKFFLFLVCLICLIGISSAISYNAETNIVTIDSESASLLDVLNIVNNSNNFSVQNSNNYTMNIESILITNSGTLTLDNDILNVNTSAENEIKITLNGNLTIKNNSIFTSINHSVRGSIYSSGSPKTFNVTDSILTHFYEISFNGYHENANLVINNSTISDYYQIDSFQTLDFINNDVSRYEFYGIRHYGELFGNIFHDTVGGTALEYPIAATGAVIHNNTFINLSNTGAVLFLKERTTCLEIVNNHFENLSGTSQSSIDIYNNNFNYVDSQPLLIHNNTFENVVNSVSYYNKGFFVFENNTINNAQTAFNIIANGNSNGTSYYRNNIISNSTNGIYIKDNILLNVTFNNNTYYNVDNPYYLKTVDNTNILFENETYTECGALYFDGASATITNPVLPIKFGSGNNQAILNMVNELTTLISKFQITIERTVFSSTPSEISWNDTKTYDATGQPVYYTIENLALNHEYNIYKNSTLLDTSNSGNEGNVSFMSYISTSGDTFTVNTTINTGGVRYNSDNPIGNRYRSDGTITYSRSINVSSDSISNLKVVFN